MKEEWYSFQLMLTEKEADTLFWDLVKKYKTVLKKKVYDDSRSDTKITSKKKRN